MLDKEGKEVPGNRGYKYFGAAKDLPGVRELFEHERKFKTKHSVVVNYKNQVFGTFQYGWGVAHLSGIS